MRTFLEIDVGLAILLFLLVPAAILVLKTDAKMHRRSVKRNEQRTERAKQQAEESARAALAEEEEMQRRYEEAQKELIYALHAPIVDQDGNRWGRTLRTPPPWM